MPRASQEAEDTKALYRIADDSHCRMFSVSWCLDTNAEGKGMDII